MFEFAGYHIALAGIGGAILLSHWFPRLISGREPAASALLILMGFAFALLAPQLSVAVNPVTVPKLWEIASELCLIIGLFGVGIRIDRLKSWTMWRPTIGLLVIAMPLSIAAVALMGWWGGMSIAAALLLGAVLAPTDPVLAADVQVGGPLEGGEHPVRMTLTTEAGLNDGLAFPFVHLAIALALAGSWSTALAGNWLLVDVAYRITIGVMCGTALGWLVAKFLFDWPRGNSLSDTGSGVAALAGVLIVYGLTELAEGYGFIAVFLAGLTLRRQETRHAFHVKLHDFIEALEQSLTAILLLALGAALPVLIIGLTWSMVGIGLALIFVIRPLAAWLALTKTGLTGRGRGVVAFYGVRGVGSIYYLAYAATHANFADVHQLWGVVAVAIITSTIVHGFTAGIAVDHATKSSAT